LKEKGSQTDKARKRRKGKKCKKERKGGAKRETRLLYKCRTARSEGTNGVKSHRIDDGSKIDAYFEYVSPTESYQVFVTDQAAVAGWLPVILNQICAPSLQKKN